MNLKHEISEKLKEIRRPNWNPLIAPDQKRELRRVYALLDFFLSHFIDNYLDANEQTIIKALEKDSPIPKEILELLLQQEQEGKNREKVVSILMKMKGITEERGNGFRNTSEVFR
jgi:hypothetical protein